MTGEITSNRSRHRFGVTAAKTRPRRPEAGYTLLLALFLGALMIIAAAVAVPNLLTQSRREKEALMIWRGQQYARAIGLFYRKTGRFPHNLEELEKGVAGVHFLRQAYKDPMNTEDGSWRLIYLGPGGQFIGSLRWHTMAEYQAAQMGIPLPGTQTAGSPIGFTPVGATPIGASSFGPVTAGTASAFGSPLGWSGRQSQNGQQGTASSSQPQTQIIEEGQMVGGNLVGVASKVKQDSLKVFMGGKTYRLWEFIWNPMTGQALGSVGGTAARSNGQQPGNAQPNSSQAPSGFGMSTPTPTGTPTPSQPPFGGTPTQNPKPPGPGSLDP